MKLLDRVFRKKKEKGPAPITVCSFYNVYGQLGYPRREGHLIQAKMQSGKTAIYKCVNIRYCMDPQDMFWLDYEFDHYQKPDEREYPIYC